MNEKPKSMRVLLSAYACEPGRGSEPGVGWSWLLLLAKHHHVRVLTRRNNVGAILKGLARHPGLRERVECEPHDCGDLVLWCKRHRVLPVWLYYLIWQITAAWKMRGRLGEFDLVHHVTFNGFRTPGLWWSRKTKVVLGPLGGAAVCPRQLLRTFGWRAIGEAIRGASVRLWFLNPWTIRSLRRADRVLVVTEHMAREFTRHGVRSSVLLECGVPGELEAPPNAGSLIRRRGFVWAGSMEPFKGWSLGLRAFARAFQGQPDAPLLRMFGIGAHWEKAKTLARDLGIGDLVVFEGRQGQAVVWDCFRQSRGLLFPSVRDTSGNVILEALACGCPVVCLNHHGAGEMTDDSCAWRVEPASPEEIIEGLAEGLRRLQEEDGLVESMGACGRERVMRLFTWAEKGRRMEGIFEELAGAAPPCLQPLEKE